MFKNYASLMWQSEPSGSPFAYLQYLKEKLLSSLLPIIIGTCMLNNSQIIVYKATLLFNMCFYMVEPNFFFFFFFFFYLIILQKKTKKKTKKKNPQTTNPPPTHYPTLLHIYTQQTTTTNKITHTNHKQPKPT